MEKCSLCENSLGFELSTINLTSEDVNVNLICEQCQEAFTVLNEMTVPESNVLKDLAGDLEKEIKENHRPKGFKSEISILYRDGSGNRSVRHINNLKIENGKQVVCYCELRKEVRTFNIDRIEELVFTNTSVDGTVKSGNLDDQHDILKCLKEYIDYESELEDDIDVDMGQTTEGDVDFGEDDDENESFDCHDHGDVSESFSSSQEIQDHIDGLCGFKINPSVFPDTCPPVFTEYVGNWPKEVDQSVSLYKMRSELEQKITSKLLKVEQELKVDIEDIIEDFRNS